MIIAIALLSACKPSTTENNTTAQLEDIPEVQSDLEQLESLAYALDRDTSSNCDIYTYSQGTAETKVMRQQKDGNLVKIYWQSFTEHGWQICELYQTGEELPLYFRSRMMRHSCTGPGEACYIERKVLLEHGQVTHSYLAEVQHHYSTPIDYDTIAFVEEDVSDGNALADYQSARKFIDRDLGEGSFSPAGIHLGNYMYFADAAVFRPCGDDELIYAVQSFDMEAAYLRSGVSAEYVDAAVVGHLETQPNMEGKPRPHLVVHHIIDMHAEDYCDYSFNN